MDTHTPAVPVSPENLDISVVIPMLNEEENVHPLLTRLQQVLEARTSRYEIIAVDDGSRDETFHRLLQLKDRLPLRIIQFTRSFGQHPAISAGFQLVRGEVVFTMDADMQVPVEAIPTLLDKLQSGYDVVNGWRKKRYDPLLRRVSSVFINRLIGQLTSVYRRDIGCMMVAYRRWVVDILNQCPERSKLIPVLVNWIGVRIAEVEVPHSERRGKSRYHFFRLMQQTLDIVTGYSTKPVQMLSLFGMFSLVLGLAGWLILGVWGSAWSDRAFYSGMVLSTGLVLLAINIGCVSLIGEYVVRIFTDVQKRPYYIIKQIIE